MAKEPLGIAAYNGLAVPVNGESEIRQVDSSRTVLTMTHSSDNSGRFQTWRDYGLLNSTLAGVDLAAIDADGGFLALSGSTVKLELNSSGLYKGTTQIIGAAGGYKQPIVSLTGATTEHTILTTNAGKLHVISTQAASSVFIHLPASSLIAVGESYEFLANTSAADLFHFMLVGTSGVIHTHIASTNVVETTGAVTHGSSGALWLKFTVISTATGGDWACQNLMAAGPVFTTNAYFSLLEGTTA